MSKTDIIARMRRDGTVVEVLPDGIERPFPDTPMRPMTEAEVRAAALADPDAQSLTEEKLARMKRVTRQDPAPRARLDAGRIRGALSHPDRHVTRLGTGAI